MNPLASCHRRRSKSTPAAVSLALLLLICSPAQAARSTHRAVKHRPATVSLTSVVRAPVGTASTAPAGAAGMVIAIDPETGTLVPPSAAQLMRLTSAERTGLMRTSEGLSEVRLPDGTVMVDLQGRFMEFTVVRLDPEGRLQFAGVNEAPAVLRLLDPRTPAPTPAGEER